MDTDKAAKKAAKEQERKDRAILRDREHQIREVKKFNTSVERDRVDWEKQVARSRMFLDSAENYFGTTSSEVIVLKKEEKLYLDLPGGLVEDRAGQAQFVSGHQGISVPLFNLNGHAVRYNIGATRGHIERPAPLQQ